MKHLLALLLLPTFLLSSCALYLGDEQPTDAVTEQITEEATQTTEAVQSTGEPEEEKPDSSDPYLLLVNQTHPLGETDVPTHLTALPTEYTRESIQLDETVANAVMLLLDEMKKDGIADCLVTSGYRSYSYQKGLFNQYLTEESSAISQNAYRVLGETYIRENYIEKSKNALSIADAYTVVSSYSAVPGTSEHQTGLCVDFIVNGMLELRNETDETAGLGFENTDAFRWLTENAHRFGFILRYPSDKTDVTGYQYESWHYRYVGVEHATAIRERGITLEEYLQ